MKIRSYTGLLAVLATGIIGLTSCGATAAKVTGTYIGSFTKEVDNSYKDDNDNWIESKATYSYYEQLQLLDNGTYHMSQFNPISAQSTIYVVYAEGNYTMGEKNAKYDGYTEIKLEDASYVQINQDIYNEMFTLCIDTETSTFPHEIAGGATKTKEQILSEYGSFGSRFIAHNATVDDTHVENIIVIEDKVKIVE